MKSASASPRVAVVGLLTIAGCLPGYEYVADGDRSTSGTGGGASSGTVDASSSASTSASGSGSGSGSGAGGASACPLGRATAGPYGAAELYLGEPEVDAIAPANFSEYHALVSPDGLRITRRWEGGRIAEYARNDVTAEWGEPVATDYLFYELFPRLTADNLRVFSCHGGELKCMVHARTSVDESFVLEHYFQEFPPFDGDAADFCFVPTPDGQHLAFCSDRESAESDAPEGLLDLWVAVANDPDDAASGYRDLVRLDAPSSPGDHDQPTWISDDGLTIAFHTTRGGTRDIYVTSRPDLDSSFGAAVELAEIAGGSTDESFFSLPSLDVLRAQPCAQGYGYFQRENQIMRLPVCVGAPCN